MIAALRYEWVRVSTIRSTKILLVLVLAGTMALGWLIADPWYVTYDEAGNPVGPLVVNWWDALGIPLTITAVLASVIAAQAIGQEYRFGLIRLTLTAFPRRPRILAAKVVVVAFACVVFALVSILGSWFGLVLRGYPTPSDEISAPQELFLLKGVVFVVLWGLSAFALAGITRQTGLGIAVPIVSGLIVESLLGAILADRAGWLVEILPWSTASRWSAASIASADFDGSMLIDLPVGWAALGVFAVWVAALLALQVVSFLRRDA